MDYNSAGLMELKLSVCGDKVTEGSLHVAPKTETLCSVVLCVSVSCLSRDRSKWLQDDYYKEANGAQKLIQKGGLKSGAPKGVVQRSHNTAFTSTWKLFHRLQIVRDRQPSLFADPLTE